MNFLGLNSPGIFVISVIVLIILGPKRVEKGWLLFQRLLKFLLSNKEVNEVKEELVEAKSEEPEVIEVKEELVEARTKMKKPKSKKS